MAFLEQASIFLGTAVIVVPLFRRLRLGAVLGYLAAGAVIGPWGIGLDGTVRSFRACCTWWESRSRRSRWSYQQVDLVRRLGGKVYYGDASRLDLLESAKIRDARLCARH
jgi:voltage-gated potassium channel Kch